MVRTGLILAAHGSSAEPEVNVQVAALARRIASRGDFDEVRCGFHLGTPRFADALDQMSATEVTVVPLMTSDGYYATSVLPEKLATANRFDDVTLRQTSAVGAHPRIPELVASRCRTVLSEFGCTPEASTVIVIGHGTPRHTQSRATTLRCAAALSQAHVAGAVLPAFLDDEPGIAETLSRVTHSDVVVIPFMIGYGRHVTRDIAGRLGMTSDVDAARACATRVQERRVILDRPIGVDPGIEAFVIELAAPRGRVKGS